MTYTGFVAGPNGENTKFEGSNIKEITEKVCKSVESCFGLMEFPHGCVCSESGNVWTITLNEQGVASGIQRY